MSERPTPETYLVTYRVPQKDSLYFVEGMREVVSADFARRLERQRDELAEALRKIEGGCFPNASTLVVNGDWHGAYDALQTIAREALDEALNATKSAPKVWRMSRRRFERAPCYLCGYNGPGYYQPDQHPCAKLYHASILCEEQ